jgi:hypothetical protein
MSNDSGIQSGGQGGGGGRFPPVQKGKDFFDNLPHCRDRWGENPTVFGDSRKTGRTLKKRSKNC